MDVTDIEIAQQWSAGRLDAFAFFPGISSRIVGLGGGATGHDPTYAFHTDYVRVARGPATFTVRIGGLSATRGTLTVRVHAMPLDRSAHAGLVNSERISLAKLARQGGEMTVGFEGFRGMSYAVLGSISDDTDAVAMTLAIVLDRPDDGSVEADDESATSGAARVGNDGLVATAQLVSIAAPSLASPVSQIYTAAQTREAPFARWRERLDDDAATEPRLWSRVYILETLNRYSMLERGARGLALDADCGPLPAVMAALGVSTVVAGCDPGMEEETLDCLRRLNLCDKATFEAHVSVRGADLRALPAEFVGFDFLWSCRTAGGLGSIAGGLKFIDEAMACISAGGLAVHVLDLATAPEGPSQEDGRLVFRAGDVERIALQLISRGHEVAQVRAAARNAGDRDARFASGDLPPSTVPFGLIARRGRRQL